MAHPTPVCKSETEKEKHPGPKAVLQRHINPISKAVQYTHGFLAMIQEERPSVCHTAVSLFHGG